jgi:hypothetical protein
MGKGRKAQKRAQRRARAADTLTPPQPEDDVAMGDVEPDEQVNVAEVLGNTMAENEQYDHLLQGGGSVNVTQPPKKPPGAAMLAHTIFVGQESALRLLSDTIHEHPSPGLWIPLARLALGHFRAFT